MIFNSFMRTKRPKRFHLTPRYYNEREEALQELVEMAKSDKARGIPSRHRIKFERKHSVHNVNKGSNVRLVVIIAVLSLLVFLMLR